MGLKTWSHNDKPIPVACICNTGPDTDGPDEECPVHGRVEPGNWVMIFAQLAKSDKPVHPEDYLIEVFSHSDQYDIHIRRDHVRLIDPPFEQGIAYRCPSVSKQTTGKFEYLLQCEWHHDHPGEHHANDVQGCHLVWTESQQYGDVEVS